MLELKIAGRSEGGGRSGIVFDDNGNGYSINNIQIDLDLI